MELAAMRRTVEAMNAAMWLAMQERFHGFDAIRDDKCPACGGAVVAEHFDTAADGFPEGVRLTVRS